MKDLENCLDIITVLTVIQAVEKMLDRELPLGGQSQQ